MLNYSPYQHNLDKKVTDYYIQTWTGSLLALTYFLHWFTAWSLPPSLMKVYVMMHSFKWNSSLVYCFILLHIVLQVSILISERFKSLRCLILELNFRSASVPRDAFQPIALPEFELSQWEFQKFRLLPGKLSRLLVDRAKLPFFWLDNVTLKEVLSTTICDLIYFLTACKSATFVKDANIWAIFGIIQQRNFTKCNKINT